MQLVFRCPAACAAATARVMADGAVRAYIALDAELPGTNDYQGSLSKMISVRYRSPTSGCRNTLSGGAGSIWPSSTRTVTTCRSCRRPRSSSRAGTNCRRIGGRRDVLFRRAYDLQCLADIRALYLEIPRESLRNRLARQDFPIAGNVGIGSGVGKLAAQLCVNLAAESRAITHADGWLGAELLNIVALALDRDGRTRMATRIGRRG